MGGCRCVFRDCDVSTARYPKMHFFHFPKDRARFQLWSRMAGVTQIMDLTPAQQRNKVVCARHFRDEHFMNYKKDRLHKGDSVIPTITRVSKSLALDYENLSNESIDDPKLIKLEPPTLKHLIPPEDFECPLDLPADDDSYSMEALDKKYESDPTHEPEKQSRSDVSKNNSLLTQPLKIPQSNLNSAVGKDNNSIPKRVKIVHIENPTSTVPMLLPSPEQMDKDESVDNTDVTIQIYNLDDELDVFETVDVQVERNTETETKSQLTQSQLESDLATANKLLESLHNASIENAIFKEKYELLNENYKTKIQRLKDAHADALARQRSIEEEAKEWQRKYQELKQQTEQNLIQQEQHQVSTISTSNNSTCSSCKCANATKAERPSSAPAHLTKVQLFTGIKKYLSASMVALVRMELFGSTDRQWKADEQRVSVDLFRLGENIYQYFTDEWRIRLPSIRTARSWLNKCNEAVSSDEDL